MVFSKKWLRNRPKFLLHFLIHIDVLKLCSKFEVIPTSLFQVTVILRKHQILKNTPMVFSKKWLRNHPKFLLHFLIHIDVLKLCSKFEVIPTSLFQVTVILRKHQILKNTPMVFSKKWLRNHPKFLLHFLIHIDVLKLCSKFEVIPTSLFQVTVILRKHQILKNTLYYSPWFFPKNGSEITPNFYYIF